MSDAIVFLAMIAAAAFGTTSLMVLLRVAYKRTDDILTGVVNGVSVSLPSRWLLFLHDYLGLSFSGPFLLLAYAVAWFGAVQGASIPAAKTVAYLMAGISAWGCFFNLILSLIWSWHFVTVLRRASAFEVQP